MHGSRLGNIVIDCQGDSLLDAARFWSGALGYPLPADPDAGGRYIQLATPPGEVQVVLQRVDHAPGIHLDVDTDAIEAEVARLQQLGASVAARREKWVVMQAPTGQRFCVGSPYREGFEQAANRWP